LDYKNLKNLIRSRRVDEYNIKKTFKLLYAKCDKLAGSKREIFLFDIRLFFSTQIHSKLMQRDLKACLRILEVALVAVQIEDPICTSSFVLWPFKLICLIVCFQAMSTLHMTVDFCVAKQESFKSLVQKKATMNFLLTFNILAKRLVGQEELLGRLRKFNAHCLGLDNRSNFNIGGSFNTSIVTEPREEKLDDGKKINEKLYKQLWRVMKVCQNPKLLLAIKDGVKWTDFKSDIQEVLKAFKATPIEVQVAKVSTQITMDQLKQEFLFPQYVTSSRIFHYQLEDPTFRRHVLLQVGMCIIGHYQLQKCEQSNIRSRQPILRVVQRNDQNWIVQTFEECIKLLEKTHVFVKNEKGDAVFDQERTKMLALSFRDIMLREFNYVHWKHDRSTKQKACPMICKKPQKAVEPYVYDTTKKATFEKVMVMGDQRLESLWSGETSMSSLKNDAPLVHKFLDESVRGLEEDMTDEFLQDTPDLKRMHDAKFSFHTLRLVRRVRPQKMKALNPDYKDLLTGGAITNHLYYLLTDKNPELGKAARKEIEGMGLLSKSMGSDSITVKKKGGTIKKPAAVKKPAAGAKKTGATTAKKRPSPSKEERKTKRAKFDNVSLSDLMK